jgi:creatinine amidohydrolase
MKVLSSALIVLFLAAAIPAQSRSVMIEDLTWTEVRDAIAAGKTTAIYYAGSTEQNGPHMVLGKHNFIAKYVAQRIAEHLGNALVYPVMPFAPTGDIARKTGHMKFPGSISLSPEVFGAVARDVTLSAIAAGFKNVVLMGDHGGDQEPLKKLAEALDPEWAPKGVRVYYIPDLYYKEQDDMRDYLVKHQMAPEQHAGIGDTSELCSSIRQTAGLGRTRWRPATVRRESWATRRSRQGTWERCG